MRKRLSWRNWPLASKLAILFAVLAVVPLTFVALYNDAAARTRLLVATRAQNLQAARGTAQVLDAYLAEILADMRAIADAPDTIQFLQNRRAAEAHADVEAALRQARAIHGYEALYLTDPSGVVIIATEERFIGRNYLAARWFRNASAGQVSFDEPRYDPEDAQVYLHFSAPIASPQGVILGTAIGRITMTTIDQLISVDTDFSGRGDFGVLWDDLGIRVSQGIRPDLRFKPYAPLPSDVSATIIFEERFGPATANILQDASQLPQVTERGKLLLYDRNADPYLAFDSAAMGRMQAAIVPLRNKRWLYGVFTPEANILADLDAQTRRALLTALAAGLLAVGAALMAAHWATGPIRRVAATADAIAAGDLTRRVGLAQRDEVGRLATAFDAMAATLAGKEAQLRHRATELEALNRELEAFSYSVSHDLRAPLRAIDGFSQALQEEYTGRLDETGQEYLRWVRAASQQMAQLIEGLLALSRVTRAELRREPVDLSGLAATIVEGLRRTEPDRQVEFIIVPGLTVMGDVRLLRVVLDNLLGNAWKFTSKHPSARIEFGAQTPTPSPTPARGGGESGVGAVYFVRDDGAGFDAAYGDKLFGVFQRLHGADEFDGAGIGLATVRRIIQRHGGQIWAEGAVEQGATFYFTLESSYETEDHPAG